MRKSMLISNAEEFDIKINKKKRKKDRDRSADIDGPFESYNQMSQSDIDFLE